MSRVTAVVFAFSLLTLGGCQDDDLQPPEQGDASRAEGEVLGGTIDDSMLPLDTVRSQSPPLESAVVEGEDTPAGTRTSAPPDAQPSTGPAVEPAEDPTPAAQ